MATDPLKSGVWQGGACRAPHLLAARYAAPTDPDPMWIVATEAVGAGKTAFPAPI